MIHFLCQPLKRANMVGKAVTILLVLLAILATVIAGREKPCVPGENCKPPNCRCWDDTTAPGGHKTQDIPQMVLLSFDYGVSTANVDKYRKLIEGIKNPNKCKVRGSFYVTKTYTNFSVAHDLFKEGHELGVSTIDTASPQTKKEFVGNFSAVKSELVKAGIPEKEIRGARSVELSFRGTNQVAGMLPNKLQYDSTCLNDRFTWPYTYDFVSTIPTCFSGAKITKSFPGVWEVPVSDLQFKGVKCSVPSACSPYIKTDKDAFNLLFNTFKTHYNMDIRPPFVLIIDPAWILNPVHASGTRQFLKLVEKSYKDAWILTAEQALAWIKKPVKASRAKKFKPWGC